MKLTKKIKISLVTLTFNSEKTVEKTIKSVLSQSRLPDQFIIKDGCSTDTTKEVIMNTNFSGQFFMERDNGIYDGLNQALKKCTGDIIIFLHSDDVFFDDSVVEEIEQKFVTTDCDVLYGDLHIVTADKAQNVIRYWKPGFFKRWKLIFGWMPPHTSTVMKASVYEKVGDFNVNYRISGDYEHLLRVLKRKDIKVKYLPKVFTVMREGGASNSGLRSFQTKIIEDYRAAKQLSRLPILTIICKRLQKVTQLIFH